MKRATYEALTSDPDCSLEKTIAMSDAIVRNNRMLHRFMGTPPPSSTMYGDEIDKKRCRLTRAQFLRMKMSEQQIDTFFTQRGELFRYNNRIYEKLEAQVAELESAIMPQRVIIYDIVAYRIKVECPRCHEKGVIVIPEKKITERAFVRCRRCGLVYDDSYFGGGNPYYGYWRWSADQ